MVVLVTKKLCFLTVDRFKWPNVFFFSNYIPNFGVFMTSTGSNSEVVGEIWFKLSRNSIQIQFKTLKIRSVSFMVHIL